MDLFKNPENYAASWRKVDRLAELYPDLVERLRADGPDRGADPWLVEMVGRIEADGRLAEGERNALRSFVRGIRDSLFRQRDSILSE
jgi:hypothetical protein